MSCFDTNKQWKFPLKYFKVMSFQDRFRRLCYIARIRGRPLINEIAFWIECSFIFDTIMKCTFLIICAFFLRRNVQWVKMLSTMLKPVYYDHVSREPKLKYRRFLRNPENHVETIWEWRLPSHKSTHRGRDQMAAILQVQYIDRFT